MPISNSHGPSLPIVGSLRLLAREVSALAVVVWVSIMPAGISVAATLGLVTHWPGQADTAIGAPPETTLNARCVPEAEPTIASGVLSTSVFTGHMLQLGTHVNYGVWPENGNLDQANQNPIADLFGRSLLPGQNWRMGYPQVLYDPTGDPNGFARFIWVGAAEDGTTQPPRSWIMVGATGIGTGNIANCIYAFEVNEGMSTTFAAGAPHAGMTRDSLVLTADMYDFTTGTFGNFQYSKLWVVPKNRIYNIPHQICFPKPVPFQDWWSDGLKNPDGSYARGVVPAKSYDTGSSVTYLVSALPGGGNSLTLWTVDTQKLLLFPGFPGTGLPTQPYSPPPPATQAATQSVPSPPNINTGDAGLVNAVFQPSKGLWTVQTAACQWNSKLSCLKWYQLDPVAGTVLQDSFFGIRDEHVYAPAVAANHNGNAVFVFNNSSPNRYVSLDAVGRDAGDAPNTLQQNFEVRAGFDVYSRGAPASHSAADVDPTNDNQFWIVGAYASGNVGGQDATCPDGTTNHDWRTEVGQLSFTGTSPPPPTVGYYPIPTPAGRAVVPSAQ